MPGQPFSLANLREVADALYGKRQCMACSLAISTYPSERRPEQTSCQTKGRRSFRERAKRKAPPGRVGGAEVKA
jgi:hypothetical protein